MEFQREIKQARGCGFRKVGGIYLVSDGPHLPCGLLPRELMRCPCCDGGIKQKIGFGWGRVGLILREEDRAGCGSCFDRPLPCTLPYLAQDLSRRVGVVWVGKRFYPTPEDFCREANRMGISRRVGAVPKGFKVGEDYILLAHPEACPPRQDPLCAKCGGGGVVVKEIPPVALPLLAEAGIKAPEGHEEPCPVCTRPRPGVFGIFRPTRVETIITESQAEDEKFTAALIKRGLTPVVVPDGDPDHQGRERKAR